METMQQQLEKGEIRMSLVKDKFAFPKTRRFSPVKVLNQ